MRTLALTTLLLAACGADSGGSKNTTQEPQITSRVVMYLSDLPTCTPELEGALVYVKGREAFQYCESGKWIEIDLRGKDGLAGAPGKDATAGMTIESQFSCTGGGTDLDPDPNVQTKMLSAKVTKFTDGSYWMECISEVVDGDLETLERNTSSAFTPAAIVENTLVCTLFSVLGEYSIAEETARFSLLTVGEKDEETVECTQSYP